ncbi:unnamed protein product [Pseudo-nitzschia multistriata]|uniref:SET domain-containing protein n=1 Tax=Pseudo-nitzschia multistriata TaxID=183589 RepID=A0A448Z595_9STRA|nr:unnamed protein product [Pseudo-nitzschia multistriata]
MTMKGLSAPMLMLALLLGSKNYLRAANAFGLGAFDLLQNAPSWTDADAIGSATEAARAHAVSFWSSSQSLAAIDFSDTDFGPPSGSSNQVLTEADLWTLRIGSAMATYFGFVAVNDRPRGGLALPLDPSDDECCLRVQQSNVPGAGLGLFANQNLPKGTILGTYPGVLLPLQQHSAASKIRDHPECLAYIWRFTDNEFVIDPTLSSDGSLPEYCSGGNPSQPLSVPFFALLRILGVLPKTSTALCRINEPPLGGDVNVATEEDLAGRTVTFLLERNVYAGEELYIDYGLTYDRSRYTASR